MNILTFDIEEWITDKRIRSLVGNRDKILDSYLKAILDLLDEHNIKGTFFCVGEVAKEFPQVVRSISERGHEIGCHSNTHLWLTSFDKVGLKEDTETAIHSIEDVIGSKVVSYRAPAYTIGEQNKWALEILAECGIERDASIYPSNRDFGGYPGFPSLEPCVVKVGNQTIKEFPISLTQIAGKYLAYSGGGYFRFFPMLFIKNIMEHSDYVMTYFHIADLQHIKFQMLSKEYFEEYLGVKGTYKNRIVRMIKKGFGTKGAFEKMCNLVRSFDYVNIDEADRSINWSEAQIIIL